jgi:hypothetical protein
MAALDNTPVLFVSVTDEVILSREALWTAAAPAAAFKHVIQSGGCATALHSDFVAKVRF